MNQVYIKRLNNQAIIPKKATIGSAGYDLFANIKTKYIIEPNEIKKIPTGISLDLNNKELVGLLFIRSGLSTKHRIILANNVGVIDSDYRGEIFIVIKNCSAKKYIIEPNDRIAQLLIIPVPNIDFVESNTNLSHTTRNCCGFGSTGKNMLNN